MIPFGETATIASRDWLRQALFGAAIGGMTLITIALCILGGGNLGAAVAPVAGVLLLFVLWKVPLRVSVLVLIFLGLTMENPYEGFANGAFQSPVAPLGALLLANINRTTGISALNFTGLDLLVPFLLFIHFYRRVTHSNIDGKGQIETARPMRLFALVSLVTNFALYAWGLLRGGDGAQALWQVHQVLLLPVVFFLCEAAFRGPQDHATLGKVIVAAGLLRGMAAILLRRFLKPTTEWMVHYPYATTHADSMLFAGAFAILLALFVQRPTRKTLLQLALCSVVLMGAMVANSRRIVWVEVIGVAIAYYLFARRTPLMRRLTRLVAMSLPLILVYVAAGWNSAAKVFGPVQTIRSMVDPTGVKDTSTEWRDLENLNLIFTLDEHPLLGPGFGHQYKEAIPLPDISSSFQAYRYFPHNALLGLWAFTGLIGFSGMWMMLVVCVFLAARSYARAALPAQRVAALACVSCVIIYTNQVYGDMGLVSWTGVFLVAPAMAVAGKLAVETGAWPRTLRRRPHAAPATAAAGMAVGIPEA